MVKESCELDVFSELFSKLKVLKRYKIEFAHLKYSNNNY